MTGVAGKVIAVTGVSSGIGAPAPSHSRGRAPWWPGSGVQGTPMDEITDALAGKWTR